MKGKIGNAYRLKSPEAADMMEIGIENYLAMLQSFMDVDPSCTDRNSESIEPMNGKERLEFIRGKIEGHFAFVQMDALYTEAMKKAVSRLAMQK